MEKSTPTFASESAGPIAFREQNRTRAISTFCSTSAHLFVADCDFVTTLLIFFIEGWFVDLQLFANKSAFY